MLGPTFSPGAQTGKLSGVQVDSSLEGHLLWDLASINAWLSQESSVLDFKLTELN